MKKIQNFEQFNESETIGKILGNISKGVKKLGWLIGKTGSDEDLAGEILDYLMKLPQDYVAETDFKKDRVYNPSVGTFVFFGKIFPRDSKSEYRIDVIQASNPAIGLHKEPFRIIISKLSEKKVTSPTGGNKVKYEPFSKFEKGRTGRSRVSKSELLITANPISTEEMVQLECSQQIGKKIFNKCQEIWNKTNPNTKGRARGGQNTPSTKGKGLMGRLGLTW